MQAWNSAIKLGLQQAEDLKQQLYKHIIAQLDAAKQEGGKQLGELIKSLLKQGFDKKMELTEGRTLQSYIDEQAKLKAQERPKKPDQPQEDVKENKQRQWEYQHHDDQDDWETTLKKFKNNIKLEEDGLTEAEIMAAEQELLAMKRNLEAQANPGTSVQPKLAKKPKGDKGQGPDQQGA